MNSGDYFAYLLMAVVVCILAFIIAVVITGEDEPDFRTACEDIGGSYEVIGQEFSPSVKTNVDIYGCVK